MNDHDHHISQYYALRSICRALFGPNNLIPSDFANIAVQLLKQEFAQDSTGIRIEFDVSLHALGKIVRTDAQSLAIDALVKDEFAEFEKAQAAERNG